MYFTREYQKFIPTFKEPRNFKCMIYVAIDFMHYHTWDKGGLPFLGGISGPTTILPTQLVNTLLTAGEVGKLAQQVSGYLSIYIFKSSLLVIYFTLSSIFCNMLFLPE